MLSQGREEKRTIIFNPKFTSRVCKFEYSRLALIIPVRWLQVLFTKPDLISAPPGGLCGGAVCVDIEK